MGYIDQVVAPLSPTYFWTFQDTLKPSHGSVSMVPIVLSGFETGPGVEHGDVAAYSPTMHLQYAINSNAMTTAYSYGGWFNIKTFLSDRPPMAWTTTAMMYFPTATNMNGYHNGGPYFEHAHGIAANTWHHYMMTWSGTVLTLYVDGIVKGSVARTGALGAIATGEIGTYANRAQSRTPMAAAYVGIWVNVCLSQVQVQSLASRPHVNLRDGSKAAVTY